MFRIYKLINSTTILVYRQNIANLKIYIFRHKRLHKCLYKWSIGTLKGAYDCSSNNEDTLHPTNKCQMKTDDIWGHSNQRGGQMPILQPETFSKTRFVCFISLSTFENFKISDIIMFVIILILKYFSNSLHILCILLSNLKYFLQTLILETAFSFS